MARREHGKGHAPCSVRTTYPHQYQQSSSEGILQGKTGRPDSSAAGHQVAQGFESGSPSPAGFSQLPWEQPHRSCPVSFPSTSSVMLQFLHVTLCARRPTWYCLDWWTKNTQARLHQQLLQWRNSTNEMFHSLISIQKKVFSLEKQLWDY